MQWAMYIASTMTVLRNKIILYCKINELFCISLITLPCIANKVLFKQTVLNKILHTQKYLLNCFSHAFPVNSLDKASELPYIFIHVNIAGLLDDHPSSIDISPDNLPSTVDAEKLLSEFGILLFTILNLWRILVQNMGISKDMAHPQYIF